MLVHIHARLPYIIKNLFFLLFFSSYIISVQENIIPEKPSCESDTTELNTKWFIKLNSCNNTE